RHDPLVLPGIPCQHDLAYRPLAPCHPHQLSREIAHQLPAPSRPNHAAPPSVLRTYSLILPSAGPSGAAPLLVSHVMPPQHVTARAGESCRTRTTTAVVPPASAPVTARVTLPLSVKSKTPA